MPFKTQILFYSLDPGSLLSVIEIEEKMWTITSSKNEPGFNQIHLRTSLQLLDQILNSVFLLYKILWTLKKFFLRMENLQNIAWHLDVKFSLKQLWFFFFLQHLIQEYMLFYIFVMWTHCTVWRWQRTWVNWVENFLPSHSSSDSSLAMSFWLFLVKALTKRFWT